MGIVFEEVELPKTLWHLYIRLVALLAMSKEIDVNVWHNDDSLEQCRSYLEEIASQCEVALDYIKELKQKKEKEEAKR